MFTRKMFKKLLNKLIPVSDGVKKIGQHMIDNPMDWELGRWRFINKTNPDIYEYDKIQ